MAKRYLDIEGLQTYDALIKQYIEDTITERLRDFKTTTTEEFNNVYDDVKTFNSKNDFPAVGVKDALYLSLDDGKSYTWDGSQYVVTSSEISDSAISALFK